MNPTSKSLQRSGHHGLSRRLLALSGSLLCALSAQAASPPNFDGVWKLAAPQASLRPSDGEIPFTAEGRKAYLDNKAAAAKGDYSFDWTETRCSAPGLPRLMLTPELIKIYQRPQMIAMLFEWNRLLRQIDLRPETLQRELQNPMQDNATNDIVGTTNGTSSAHWEGDVLVVHSIKFSPQKLLDEFIPNTLEMELTEHIRLRGRNTLEDRLTIKDAEYFTRPWDAVLTYQRQSDDLFPFRENVCLDRKNAGELPLAR